MTGAALKPTALGLCALALFAGFAALGTWQLHRLDWKRELIARVQARVHTAPAPAPGRAHWASVNAKGYEYVRVRASGRYIGDAQELVRATTRLGRGFWVLTPLQTQRGFIVFINRGFVASADSGEPGFSVPAPEGRVRVAGLLRMSEPGGRFLRPNDPAQGRWYSRDVVALAASAGLAPYDVAPYFIDAGASTQGGEPPIGGLTRLRFRNAHLIYAITWYVLAALVVVAAITVVRYQGSERGHDDARNRR